MRIKLTEVEPLEIEFSDGTVRQAKFTMACLTHFAERFGNLPTETELVSDPDGWQAKLLFCGFLAAGEKDISESMCLNLIRSDYGALIGLYMSHLLEETFKSQLDEASKKKADQAIASSQQKVLSLLMSQQT